MRGGDHVYVRKDTTCYESGEPVIAGEHGRVIRVLGSFVAVTISGGDPRRVAVPRDDLWDEDEYNAEEIRRGVSRGSPSTRGRDSAPAQG